MTPRSLRILAKTKHGTKLLFQLKELRNGDALYSFGPLDGRTASRLHAEIIEEIEPGSRTYGYQEGQVISETVDHLSLHTSGHHVISSPRTKAEKSKHWGMIVQPKLQVPFEWRPFGIVLPAAFERFPDHAQPFDPTRDAQIDLTVLGISWLYFELGIIGKKLEKDKPAFLVVPPGMVNASATRIEECFVGALDWFMLPLTSYTMLVVLKTKPEGPLPPRTAFVRWEAGDRAESHVAYLE